mmetsp:Transcript_3798/g.13561  ORF Transcript_3798/g.13561 Transcript_3798/m.13561 type:complete len:239 (-) Transcript_3798:420-1136(-)
MHPLVLSWPEQQEDDNDASPQHKDTEAAAEAGASPPREEEPQVLDDVSRSLLATRQAYATSAAELGSALSADTPEEPLPASSGPVSDQDYHLRPTPPHEAQRVQAVTAASSAPRPAEGGSGCIRRTPSSSGLSRLHGSATGVAEHGQVHVSLPQTTGRSPSTRSNILRRHKSSVAAGLLAGAETPSSNPWGTPLDWHSQVASWLQPVVGRRNLRLVYLLLGMAAGLVAGSTLGLMQVR